jgi:hypothetical protein
MTNTLKTSLRGLLVLAFVSVCLAAAARAQNREEHFISARAGGINFVSGAVTSRQAGEADWQQLSSKDDLKGGDVVRTGAEGRVEVLLNPGSFFRAGGGTEFELTDATLDNLQLKLSRGSAVVEATGYDELGLSIVVNTPQTRVRIVRSGVYRLNILPSGTTEVAVLKGRAVVGAGEGTLVKGGHMTSVGASGAEVAKLDKKNRDTLDQWSRDRGKELARANASLANRNTNSLLARTSFNSLFSAANRFDPVGVWLWNVRSSCYTFLPFLSDWRSPYGFGYDSWLYSPFGYTPGYPCGSCRQSDRPNVVDRGYSNPGTTVQITPRGTTNGGPPSSTPNVNPQPMPMPRPVIDRTDAGERPMRQRTIQPLR